MRASCPSFARMLCWNDKGGLPMMLADIITQLRGTKVDIVMQGAFSSMADVISKAQRFQFSTEASEACDQLSRSKPSSLLEATRFCRAPFSTMWIEWPPVNLLVTGDQIVPSKMGVLIECIDETYKRFGLTFCWTDDGSHTTREQRRSTMGGVGGQAPFGLRLRT